MRVRIERALPMQPSFRIRYQVRIEPFQASIRNRISACWPSQSGQLLSKRDLPRDASRFVSPLLRTLIVYSRHHPASSRLRAQRVQRVGCVYGCSRTRSVLCFLSHVTVLITCTAYQYARYDYCWLFARESLPRNILESQWIGLMPHGSGQHSVAGLVDLIIIIYGSQTLCRRTSW